jgi:S-DNA-T family DNA segregation ATPase FtsK/SpoIIIE
MLGERQRLEALGIGLMALGVLITLATLYPALAPTEANLIGPAGAAVYRWGSAAFGLLTFLITVPAFAWGAYCLRLTGRETAIRMSILGPGLMLLLPSGFWLLSGQDEAAAGAAGWLGRTVGGLVSAAFGSLGAGLILGALILVLVVATLGLSPRDLLAASFTAVRTITGWLGRALAAAWRALVELFREGRWSEEQTPWEATDQSPDADEEEFAVDPDLLAGRGVPDLPDAQLPLGDPGAPNLTEHPPVTLLAEPVRRSDGLEKRELQALGGILIDKLATFRIDGEIGGWTTGPVVTQFEVVPAAGVKVGQISARADDLALALRAPSVRIVAPIPGKGAVGVEVPNPEPEVVYLREVLEAPVYKRSRSLLPLALGRDLSGRPYCADLTRMPHLLIAGATGTGKSICMNTIITSLIYRYTPQELRLLMIDPKMVELSVYNHLPHLRHPVVTDNDDAASVFKWAVFEMRRRFGLLSANACRNLPEFNQRVRDGREMYAAKPKWSDTGEAADVPPYEDGEMPFIVLLIDELADLMMTVQAEVETPLAMLAQKARAVGIHLVVATQRPSVNVITGLIKANFPSRIAFRVASKTDSRTILDQNGAESLLGNGDMLFLPPGESDPVRIQGAYISSEDTEAILAWYREQSAPRSAEGAEPDILEMVRELEDEESRIDVAEEVLEDRDELFRQAAEIVITNSSGSTSLLQRRLKIGYGRAARIIDQLHHAGIVGPAEGSKPREILAGLEDLEDLQFE